MDIDYSKIKGKKVLLYSGGMDSWLIAKIWNPDVKLYVNINGRYNKQEIKHLPKDVIIETLDLSKWERTDKIIPLRNLYLTMIASNYGDKICLGATAGDRVLDKSYDFANRTSDILSFLYSKQWWIPEGRNIEICLDFKNKTKVDLLTDYINNGGNIETAWTESFSCYEPDDKGNVCMQCKPCFRKFIAFATLGFIDKTWLPTVIPYIGKNIIPDIKNGTYGRGKSEETQIMNIYKQYIQYDK
jgi:7-cyano-7-deazaguanine synthase